MKKLGWMNKVQPKGALSLKERQRRMDEIPVDFCERLYMANGFVTEITAGHVVSIQRETE